jgi:hypothetical protein
MFYELERINTLAKGL